ncbi:MAG: T9SS type A sorting domain-containing protein, partial [Bacteroidota bacterium]
IRLNQDGSIDNTFNIGNGAGGDKSYILNMIELPSNELIISGGYQSFDNIQVPGFAKLSEDGSIDAEFMDKQPLDANGSFPSGPTSILQLEDQLFIGGLLRAKGSNVNSEQILSLKFDGTWNEDFCIDNILEIEQIWGLAKGPDNTFFAFGNFFDKSGDRQFVVKISADPNPKITSLDAGLVTESKVYPNPADVDVITFDSPLFKGTELKLFDNMGRQVQVNYTSSEANNQTTVDIKELKNGTYLLKVMRSNTSLASHRLVINR